MSGVNRVILLGRIGNIEGKFAPTGAEICSLSLATSEKWNSKDGTKQEKTEWHKVVLWNKLAEIANKYLQKGQEVYVEGKLQTRSWDDKDGNKRYATEIVGTGINLIGGRSSEPREETKKEENNFVEDDLPF